MGYHVSHYCFISSIFKRRNKNILHSSKFMKKTVFVIKSDIPVAYPWTSSYHTQHIYPHSRRYTGRWGVPVSMGRPHTSNPYLACMLLCRSTPSLKPVCLTARRSHNARVSREEVPRRLSRASPVDRVSLVGGAKLSLGHLLAGFCFDHRLSVCLLCDIVNSVT